MSNKEHKLECLKKIEEFLEGPELFLMTFINLHPGNWRGEEMVGNMVKARSHLGLLRSLIEEENVFCRQEKKEP